MLFNVLFCFLCNSIFQFVYYLLFYLLVLELRGSFTLFCLLFCYFILLFNYEVFYFILF
jgi:hypothetical protein